MPKGQIHYSRLPFSAPEEATKLRDRLTQLRSQFFEVKSGSTKGYNCVAYAAGDDTRWWEPIVAPDPVGEEMGGYYWPEDPEIPAWFSVTAIEQIFAKGGYKACEDSRRVPGAEKIAIYGTDSTNATHVAKQRLDGVWISKMGRFADIEHGPPEDLQGGTIGQIQRFMIRYQPSLPATKPPKLLLPGGTPRGV